MSWVIENGDCRAVLQGCAAESFDAMVTDPPAGISFMGREWDNFAKSRGGVSGMVACLTEKQRRDRDNFIAFMTSVMVEAMRCLKPGAHALVWALPRTSHWTATALEDAGFEVRDCLTHHFGSGFAKSQDIGKFIDDLAGAEREVLRVEDRRSEYDGRERASAAINTNWREAEGRSDVRDVATRMVTAPATDEAKAWTGYGSALKPATEHWLLCRKPLGESSIARNVLKYGVGGLNIDGCRVVHGTDVDLTRRQRQRAATAGMNGLGQSGFKTDHEQSLYSPAGRFPPNVLFSHSEECGEECAADCPVAELDRQSGTLKSGKMKAGTKQKATTWCINSPEPEVTADTYGDSGGASRFFPTFRYQAKPARGEKEQGLGELPQRTLNRVNPGGLEHDPRWGPVAVKNNHPTVKGIPLCRWLCRLITPPGGTVLDPFAGSFTTGCAALQEGFNFFGIEQDADYCAIGAARLKHWEPIS